MWQNEQEIIEWLTDLVNLCTEPSKDPTTRVKRRQSFYRSPVYLALKDLLGPDWKESSCMDRTLSLHHKNTGWISINLDRRGIDEEKGWSWATDTIVLRVDFPRTKPRVGHPRIFIQVEDLTRKPHIREPRHVDKWLQDLKEAHELDDNAMSFLKRFDSSREDENKRKIYHDLERLISLVAQAKELANVA